jgi:NifU-like protein involved in Fe-S cluster formation
VTEATYNCNGCPSAVASASIAVSLAIGRTTDVLGELESADLIRIMGGISPGKDFYASLAVQALKNSIAEWAVKPVDALGG